MIFEQELDEIYSMFTVWMYRQYWLKYQLMTVCDTADDNYIKILCVKLGRYEAFKVL